MRPRCWLLMPRDLSGHLLRAHQKIGEGGIGLHSWTLEPLCLPDGRGWPLSEDGHGEVTRSRSAEALGSVSSPANFSRLLDRLPDFSSTIGDKWSFKCFSTMLLFLTRKISRSRSRSRLLGATGHARQQVLQRAELVSRTPGTLYGCAPLYFVSSFRLVAARVDRCHPPCRMDFAGGALGRGAASCRGNYHQNAEIARARSLSGTPCRPRQ